VLCREPGAELAWPALAPGALILLWALVDAERRFLHDRLAGTKIAMSDG